jgi:hypothetical protein
VAKNNLVVKTKRPALAYGIVPAETDPDIGRISWGQAAEMSANEIFAAQAEADQNSSRKVAEAKDFLLGFLASGTSDDRVPSRRSRRVRRPEHTL